jgi:hypothetical protein
LLQYNKPVFLSEYGCNIVTPRQFSEVGAVYGPEMTEVWSGGVVYEWTQENNRYGLVKIDSNGEAEILPDYTNLLSEMEDINPKGVHMDSFKEAKEKSVCPPNGSNWKASATLPPTPSDGACECMVQNMQCVASDKVSLITGPAGNSTLGDQLDVMCGMVGCNDISGDPEKGEYGMFSYCTPRDKLSWLYNLKASEKRAGNTCDFSGYGQEISPKRNDLASCAMIKPNTNIGDYSDDNTSILNQSSAVLSRKISSGTFSATVIFVVAAIFFV